MANIYAVQVDCRGVSTRQAWPTIVYSYIDGRFGRGPDLLYCPRYAVRRNPYVRRIKQVVDLCRHVLNVS